MADFEKFYEWLITERYMTSKEFDLLTEEAQFGYLWNYLWNKRDMNELMPHGNWNFDVGDMSIALRKAIRKEEEYK